MSIIKTTNNAKMLVWAREEIGYSVEQAAEAIGVSREVLLLAEAGERPLTLNQLRRAAEKYDFPFGYFYLSEPPHKKTYTPIPDFRIEPALREKSDYRLNLQLKKCRDRREVFIDIAARLEVEIRPFRTLANVGRVPKGVGDTIRTRLNVRDAEIESLTYDQAYQFWKEKIEDDGVLVYETQYLPLSSGVLGAAMFFDVCPIILIKRGDYLNERRLFTLLHEYAHLLMGRSAINDSGAQTIDAADTPEASLEAACNRIAAEILVPSERVVPRDYLGMKPAERMESLAKRFKVTYSTAAVCLKRMGIVSQPELASLLELRKKAHEQATGGQQQDVRIPREILARIDMGRPMFNTVLEAYSTGILDIFDASNILNLRVKKIDKLVSAMR